MTVDRALGTPTATWPPNGRSADGAAARALVLTGAVSLGTAAATAGAVLRQADPTTGGATVAVIALGSIAVLGMTLALVRAASAAARLGVERDGAAHDALMGLTKILADPSDGPHAGASARTTGEAPSSAAVPLDRVRPAVDRALARLRRETPTAPPGRPALRLARRTLHRRLTDVLVDAAARERGDTVDLSELAASVEPRVDVLVQDALRAWAFRYAAVLGFAIAGVVLAALFVVSVGPTG